MQSRAAPLVFFCLGLILSAVGARPAFAEGDDIGLEEHLGATLPLDLTFNDENGHPVTLKEIIHKPTILTFVYYKCPGICTPLLGAVAKVLGELKLKPEGDYRVVTVSFDETDTAETAQKKRVNYIAAIGKPFPESAWRFLTGDKAAITALTEAVGFHFRREGEDFIHPSTLVAISPQGKVIRYLYAGAGMDPKRVGFLPMDVQLALVEASQGKVGPTIAKVLNFCFSYDPKGRTYVLNVSRVAGVTISTLGAGFFIYLTVASRRKSQNAKKTNKEG
jgi:protein SCO1/2